MSEASDQECGFTDNQLSKPIKTHINKLEDSLEMDDLVNKQSKRNKEDCRYERADRELLEYLELLEMDDEEFSEFLNNMHLMVLGIGPPESSE